MNLVRSFSWKGFSKERGEFMLAISQPALIRVNSEGLLPATPSPLLVNAQDPRPCFARWPLWVPAWPRDSQPVPAGVVTPQGCTSTVPMANTLTCSIQESDGGEVGHKSVPCQEPVK